MDTELRAILDWDFREVSRSRSFVFDRLLDGGLWCLLVPIISATS